MANPAPEFLVRQLGHRAARTGAENCTEKGGQEDLGVLTSCPIVSLTPPEGAKAVQSISAYERLQLASKVATCRGFQAKDSLLTTAKIPSLPSA